MKLVLIRHAKTAEGPIDIERSLTPRGHRDAAAIGRHLAGIGVGPDRVAVSPARRARETWAGVQEELPGVAEIVIDDRIYDNDVDALLSVIHDVPASTAVLALVGHNPSFGELALALDDRRGDTGARRAVRDSFPTSGVAVFDGSSEWTDVGPGSMTLLSFTAPRGV